MQGTLDLSRNHINVLSCEAVVALPGGQGTASEVRLAIRYGKPVVAYSHAIQLLQDFPETVRRADDIDEVRQFLRERLEL